jgi:hypothetical protein
MEAGPLSQWLFGALAEAELPVVCVETRHMQAVLKAQINKTDRNDARGIAQMMRVGLYRPVHVKTIRSQKLRMLLTHRQLLQSKAIAIENDLRATDPWCWPRGGADEAPRPIAQHLAGHVGERPAQPRSPQAPKLIQHRHSDLILPIVARSNFHRTPSGFVPWVTRLNAPLGPPR